MEKLKQIIEAAYNDRINHDDLPEELQEAMFAFKEQLYGDLGVHIQRLGKSDSLQNFKKENTLSGHNGRKQICYKSDEVCIHNCSGLCKESC